tara:strand:+ start:2746 stop:3657 length:912 start_codon:yes stop_codon:yes gene_type:complete
MRKFIVDEDFINSRLDRWFKKKIYDVPQSFIEKNLRRGNIKVNRKKNKSSYRLQKNDQIFISDFKFVQNTNKKKKYNYKPTKKELSYSSSIFIENNENFAVINKPAGIAVQSGTKSKRNILDILRHTKEFNESSPYTVHRIDKETTGVLIVAKNRKYAQLFTSLFRIRKIHKTYLGVVVGEFENKKDTLIDYLHYYEGDKKIKAKAITHYKVLDTNNKYSLLKLNPETGRKHQIRKQLLMHGCPILGDNKYRFLTNNTKRNENLMLHAYKINFSIDNVKYNFCAEPPMIFKKTLKEKFLKIFQ